MSNPKPTQVTLPSVNIKIVIFLFLFLITNVTLAQIQTGIKGGMALLKCSDNTIQGPSEYSYPHPSWFISFMVRDRHPGFFNMGGELEYFNRFFHVKSYDGGVSGMTTYDFDISSSYLRLNLQPQFTFGSKVRFFFYPGVYGGYMIHSKINGKYFYNGSLPSWEKEVDGSASDYMTSWELGCKIGLGIDIRLYKGLNMIIENSETFPVIPAKPKFGSVNDYYVIEFCFGVGLAYTIPSR